VTAPLVAVWRAPDGREYLVDGRDPANIRRPGWEAECCLCRGVDDLVPVGDVFECATPFRCTDRSRKRRGALPAGYAERFEMGGA